MGDVGHGLLVYWESFITFSIRVCWVGKSSVYFLWTHEMQEYTLFDFENQMIMYGGKFVQA